MTTIDFHVHGTLSHSLPFDKEEFVQKIRAAKETGLTAFAITEHSHILNFPMVFDFLCDNFEQVGDYWNADGIKVFSGIEITTAESLDILVIDNRMDYILSLANQFNIAGGRSVMELLTILDKDSLVILAHPYRRHDDFPPIDELFLQRLDAIELNATDLYEKKNESKVRELAIQLGLPLVANSDTHCFPQIGVVSNKFDSDIRTIQDIKEQIKQTKFVINVSENLDARVKAAVDYKADYKKSLH